MVLEICNELSGKCYYSCFGREASSRCTSCCWQNFLLCNNNEKYSFEPCELIDPAPRPSPDGGTGEAPGKAPLP